MFDSLLSDSGCGEVAELLDSSFNFFNSSSFSFFLFSILALARSAFLYNLTIRINLIILIIRSILVILLAEEIFKIDKFLL
jgi:hypothetical protein